jgi:hypothetical protein
MPAIISREDARDKGLKRFFTGEPCKRDHIAERFTANGGCVRCMQFTTPNRQQGPRGKNVGWPAVGLVFSVPNVQPEEMEAAFRYVEAMGWHNYAVMEMRKNPALLEQYRTRITPQEVALLEAQLARARSKTRMQEAIVYLACGFSQHYYGPDVIEGDLVRCTHCKTEQRITKVSDVGHCNR